MNENEIKEEIEGLKKEILRFYEALLYRRSLRSSDTNKMPKDFTEDEDKEFLTIKYEKEKIHL